jgi:hypothetical protein
LFFFLYGNQRRDDTTAEIQWAVLRVGFFVFSFSRVSMVAAKKKRREASPGHPANARNPSCFGSNTKPLWSNAEAIRDGLIGEILGSIVLIIVPTKGLVKAPTGLSNGR